MEKVSDIYFVVHTIPFKNFNNLFRRLGDDRKWASVFFLGFFME